MSPTQKMLLNFAIAGAAGALVGRSFSKKHRWQAAGLGATAVMLLYGVTREGLLQPSA